MKVRTDYNDSISSNKKLSSLRYSQLSDGVEISLNLCLYRHRLSTTLILKFRQRKYCFLEGR
jgi:hypothetical protein